jgi:transcriptional regulator with XRE-family HTH domain
VSLKRSIKKGMAHKGVPTQRALSNISTVSESAITEIINGNSDPSISTITKLSDALNYKLSDFIKLGEE